MEWEKQSFWGTLFCPSHTLVGNQLPPSGNQTWQWEISNEKNVVFFQLKLLERWGNFQPGTCSITSKLNPSRPDQRSHVPTFRCFRSWHIPMWCFSYRFLHIDPLQRTSYMAFREHPGTKHERWKASVKILGKPYERLGCSPTYGLVILKCNPLIQMSGMLFCLFYRLISSSKNWKANTWNQVHNTSKC